LLDLEVFDVCEISSGHGKMNLLGIASLFKSKPGIAAIEASKSKVADEISPQHFTMVYVIIVILLLTCGTYLWNSPLREHVKNVRSNSGCRV
jgi:hypothetical protein